MGMLAARTPRAAPRIAPHGDLNAASKFLVGRNARHRASKGAARRLYAPPQPIVGAIGAGGRRQSPAPRHSKHSEPQRRQHHSKPGLSHRLALADPQNAGFKKARQISAPGCDPGRFPASRCRDTPTFQCKVTDAGIGVKRPGIPCPGRPTDRSALPRGSRHAAISVAAELGSRS